MVPGNQPPRHFSLRDADVSDGDDLPREKKNPFDLLFSCIAVVECPDPNVLEYGNVLPPQEKYFVDNETTYECDSGYTLRGSARRVCLPNGKWGGSTPICSRDSKPRFLPHCLPLSPQRSRRLSLFSTQRGITVLIPVSRLVL